VFSTDIFFAALIWQWLFKTCWEICALPISLTVAHYVERLENEEVEEEQVCAAEA
jgi:hypothetical protein